MYAIIANEQNTSVYASFEVISSGISELSSLDIENVYGGVDWGRVFNNTTTGLVGGAISGGIVGSFFPGGGTLAGAAAGGVGGAAAGFFGTLADELL